MSEKEPPQQPLCEICKKPLADETWIDDDDYGDVHERCLDGRQVQ
jgi:hypothetical protein